MLHVLFADRELLQHSVYQYELQQKAEAQALELAPQSAVPQRDYWRQ